MSDKFLRAKAEDQLLRETAQATSMYPPEKILHELQAPQIELEMQNEELQRAHVIMETSRDRYEDLFDFSPVSYITINRNGLIGEINLTGAALLGLDRTKLINRQFAKFVSVRDRDRWHRLFLSMMEHGDVEKHAFDMELAHADGSTFYAHLDCLRRKSIGAPPMLRLALIDISKLK
jgi:PAS domain S-box-containing protein